MKVFKGYINKMMFCPKCGSLLKTKLERGKTVMHCSCGHSSKNLDNTKIKEKVDVPKSKVEIVEEDVEAYPVTDEVTCDKCGNKETYYWLVQMRAGDEGESKFYKCTKCKHIWREKE